MKRGRKKGDCPDPAMTEECKALIAKYTREHCIALFTEDPAGVDRLLAIVKKSKRRSQENNK